MISTQTVIVEDDALTLFKRWYVIPLKWLEQIPNGDGAMLALATSCYLYERYATAELQASGKKTSEDRIVAQLATDLNVEERTAGAFWDVVRNGFLHQGMPKLRDRRKGELPAWELNGAFAVPIRLVTTTPPRLQIQPWLFRDRVLNLLLARPDRILHSRTNPFGVTYIVTRPPPEGER
ncbi:MAG: hypothetical protein NTV49_06995 [Kiritimatiellaeota bacterium]|nr:hypothetical protein [Kiritimatiellota bacterium]